MAPEVFLIGGGGHALSVAEALILEGTAPSGYYDPVDRGRLLGEVPWLGDDQVLLSRGPEQTLLYNGLGSVANTDKRRQIYLDFSLRGFRFGSLRHPNAHCSAHAEFGTASQVMAGSMIGPDARIGENTLINTGAIVEHECRIGDHCHIASGAVLCGSVRVGDGVHVGAGATVIQEREIGHGAIIAAGAVVTRDVEPMTLVAGVPARVMRTLSQPIEP